MIKTIRFDNDSQDAVWMRSNIRSVPLFCKSRFEKILGPAPEGRFELQLSNKKLKGSIRLVVTQECGIINRMFVDAFQLDSPMAKYLRRIYKLPSNKPFKRIIYVRVVQTKPLGTIAFRVCSCGCDGHLGSYGDYTDVYACKPMLRCVLGVIPKRDFNVDVFKRKVPGSRRVNVKFIDSDVFINGHSVATFAWNVIVSVIVGECDDKNVFIKVRRT